MSDADAACYKAPSVPRATGARIMMLFKLGIALIATFLGGIAAFVGAAVTLLAIQSGEISVSITRGQTVGGHVARRATDPGQFWSDVTWFGVVPFVLGAFVAWYAWRTLKGR